MNDLFKPQMQPCAGRNCGSTNPKLHSAECFEDYEKATGMAQPEQEPVAWCMPSAGEGHIVDVITPEEHDRVEGGYTVPLYTTPPQRNPLTDEEIDKLPWGPHEGNPMTFAEGLRDFARAIEAAHGIKGDS